MRMTKPLEVWVVDDDASIRWVLERALRQAGLSPVTFDHADAALAALATRRPDVLLTDVRMPGTEGLHLLEIARRDHAGLPVIVMTAHSDLDHAGRRLPRRRLRIPAEALRHRRGRCARAPRRFAGRGTRGGGRGRGDPGHPRPGARDAGGLPCDRPPLALEPLGARDRRVRHGQGARRARLHRHSPRANAPFIALNTSAIASELLESELFGHERGAFTAPRPCAAGRFEQADGGTLFLDEIGDMSTALQVRLLRVLAEGEFYRVGGNVPVTVDVRVIAATHQDLDVLVKQGRFREDLLHRLNVIRIRVPTLRERPGDIPELLAHYLATAARELGAEPKSLTARARGRLASFAWPGNVRQLVNAARRLTVTAPGREIREEDIPADLGGEGAAVNADDWCRELEAWAARHLAGGGPPLLSVATARFERTLAQAALERVQGRRQEAAKLIGWGRNTLTRKLRELGLE
jgi:two-component system nitrogen regulation response regulator GlnG